MGKVRRHNIPKLVKTYFSFNGPSFLDLPPNTDAIACVSSTPIAVVRSHHFMWEEEEGKLYCQEHERWEHI